ncbi:hypothetical protein QBC34DRAFT_338106 [Podospora aff. communis PSN243]|uniref:DUF1749-domain-containing protein n=1 Tax=Podospora aff. communis PSN243 TaxID=3040156 RepID=A0AAV9G4I3_9PEZI|nr:hypothetical protein QBC34DRAFT_338106 [Podospora aff. communis PSN243]
MPYPVTVHPFPSATRYSCAYERGAPSARNALVYIPGLTGGPHAIDLSQISSTLENSPNLGYSLWEFRMRSSYTGFGFSSLANDADDIASFVKYLRSLGKEKIVLMGHSTGCQDCIVYSIQEKKYPDTPAVDGYVLLAPVSDREMGGMILPKEAMEESVRVAKRMIDEGRGQEVMGRGSIPGIFQSPVTAYRWWSLAAKGGDDDFFSSDLSDDRLKEIFGRVDRPILFLPCEKDELVPPTVDRLQLLSRWTRSCPEGMASSLSGFVPGANHVVYDPDAWEYIAQKLDGFFRTSLNC